MSTYKVGSIEGPSGLATMRAVAVKKYSKRATDAMAMVADFPAPVSAAPSEVIVRVVAAGLNDIDINKARGKLRDLMGDVFPYVVGYDFSGIVVAVGREVTRFSPDEEVYGCLSPTLEDQVDKRRRPYGTLAEYCICDESEVAHKPANLQHEAAASVPLAALTAIQAFETARFNSKGMKKVFISGGGTSVSTVAIQLAKEVYQASHIVTTVLPTQDAAVASLFDSKVVKVLNSEKDTDSLDSCRDFDFAMDNTGDVMWMINLGLLRDKGILISTVAEPTADEAKSVFQVSAMRRVMLDMKGKKFHRAAEKAGIEYHRVFPLISGEALEQVINPHLEKGTIRPIIDSLHTFDHFGRALKILKSGNPLGKVVVRVVGPGAVPVPITPEPISLLTKSSAVIAEAGERGVVRSTAMPVEEKAEESPESTSTSTSEEEFRSAARMPRDEGVPPGLAYERLEVTAEAPFEGAELTAEGWPRPRTPPTVPPTYEGPAGFPYERGYSQGAFEPPGAEGAQQPGQRSEPAVPPGGPTATATPAEFETVRLGYEGGTSQFEPLEVYKTLPTNIDIAQASA